MVKRPKSKSEKERVEAIAKAVRGGVYPLDPDRLAGALLSHPSARERLALDEEEPTQRQLS